MTFSTRVKDTLDAPLAARSVDVLQVNMGDLCNMACKHCHMDAGPRGARVMDAEVVEHVLAALGHGGVKTLDITGGAPELNPHFRRLVDGAAKLGLAVMCRTNLTVLLESEQIVAGLVDFLADRDAQVIASMPYYMPDGVDRVRGQGAYDRSITALRMLNRAGFGTGRHRLNLVYNPQGAFMAPSEECLELEFRRELMQREGVSFDKLFAFVNMPVGRFRGFLERSGQLNRYREKLMGMFNPATLQGVMCRMLVSVGYDGMLYDCDFNLALGMGLSGGAPGHIRDFDTEALARRPITVGEHCYACTAGQGST